MCCPSNLWLKIIRLVVGFMVGCIFFATTHATPNFDDEENPVTTPRTSYGYPEAIYPLPNTPHIAPFATPIYQTFFAPVIYPVFWTATPTMVVIQQPGQDIAEPYAPAAKRRKLAEYEFASFEPATLNSEPFMCRPFMLSFSTPRIEEDSLSVATDQGMDSEDRDAVVWTSAIPLELFLHIAKHSGLQECSRLSRTCRGLRDSRSVMMRKCNAVFKSSHLATMLYSADRLDLRFKNATILGEENWPQLDFDFSKDWKLFEGKLTLKSLTLKAPHASVTKLTQSKITSLKLSKCAISGKAFEKLMHVSPYLENLALDHVVPNHRWVAFTNGFFGELAQFLPVTLKSFSLRQTKIGTHGNPLSMAHIQVAFKMMTKLESLEVHGDQSIVNKYMWNEQDQCVLALMVNHAPQLQKLILEHCNVSADQVKANTNFKGTLVIR